MKKKNGFISMTLVYTFLILFMFLMLAILRTYTEQDKFLHAINEQINDDIGAAKRSRVTVVNRLLDDNMPSGDGHIDYFKVANSSGNGSGFYYMDKKNIDNYNLTELTDENADGHTSRIYYFRGDVENNHLIFANMCFRIVRTNEDGSIRIVYNGTPSNGKCKKLKDTDFSTVSIGNSKFNETESVSYVAVDPVTGRVPEADESNTQSPIIEMLNAWYKSHFVLSDTNIVNYSEHIARNTIFCNNKESYKTTSYYKSRELSPIFIDSSNTNAYEEDNVKNIITFRCENNNDRFGMSNGSLLYPVGLLTAQDIVLAGGYLDIGDEDTYNGGVNRIMTNKDFYLYSSDSYWTISPLSNDGKMIYFHSSEEEDGVLKGDMATSSYAIRPVISLNANIVISKGDGTADAPYVVRSN